MPQHKPKTPKPQTKSAALFDQAASFVRTHFPALCPLRERQPLLELLVLLNELVEPGLLFPLDELAGGEGKGRQSRKIAAQVALNRLYTEYLGFAEELLQSASYCLALRHTFEGRPPAVEYAFEPTAENADHYFMLLLADSVSDPIAISLEQFEDETIKKLLTLFKLAKVATGCNWNAPQKPFGRIFAVRMVVADAPGYAVRIEFDPGMPGLRE